MRPLIFEFSFSFALASATTSAFDTDSSNTATNELFYQFYTFYFGLGYTYIFQRYFRILASANFGYHITNSSSDFSIVNQQNSQRVNKNATSIFSAPSFALNGALSTLLFSYISLSAKFEYVLYLSKSDIGSTQTTSQIIIGGEVAYVF